MKLHSYTVEEYGDMKHYVVMKSRVTNPYGKYWSASITLGMDVNGVGNTIEDAYRDLTNQIMDSLHLREHVKKYPLK